ncbi:MAG: hypothetical protein WA672_08900, partial [Candidatus Angelobacter sp.]
NSEKFATALVTLPRRVDDALPRTSTPKSGAANNDGPQPQAAASGSTAIIMAIFVLCAVLFVSQSSNTHPAMQTFALVLVLLAGLMALRDVA